MTVGAGQSGQAVSLPDVQMTSGGPFGIYVHVPFCATRCGYCDFNTYTPAELDVAGPAAPELDVAGPAAPELDVAGPAAPELGGANPDRWLEALRVELDLAAARLGAPPVDTLFVGGGTPSVLGGHGLSAVLDAVRDSFALSPGAEVTTEANPESTSSDFFAQIRSAGYTRVSLGMQSVAPRVLSVLDRVHSPGRALDAAGEARAAGFEHVNIDLIYGTPGESDDDLLRSVDAALGAGVDHVSAYALVIEDGTALARRVRRGEIAAPDDDVLAHRYQLLDSRLSDAGLRWYEVSNWSRPGGECRHNLGYWDGGQWWGAGPGAHGFVGSTRWWNVKHPNAYAQLLAEGTVPVAGFEQLDTGDLHTEDVMLRIRLRGGLPLAVLSDAERQRASVAVGDGLLLFDRDRLVLTDRGRLLADAVVRTLLDS